MSTPSIVCVLGNSVPLLIQPHRKGPEDKTYAEHIRAKGFNVINSSKQAVILSEIYYYLEDECIRHFPDFVIFNFGIVECTRRARPRWLQNTLAGNSWNNSIIGRRYNTPIVRGVKFFSKKLYKKTVEKFLYSLNISFRWLSPHDFGFILKDVAKRLFADTPTKKIIVIGMLPVSDWVEKRAPGTSQSIHEYNKIMEETASDYDNIIFVDPRRIFSTHTLKDISVDGIHYTALGHKILSDHLMSVLSGERNDYLGWQKINPYHRTRYANWYKRYTSRQ